MKGVAIAKLKLKLLTCSFLVCLWASPLMAQTAGSACRPPGGELKQLTLKQFQASTDTAALLRTIDVAAGYMSAAFNTPFSMDMFRSDSLSIAILPPALAYRISVSEALRKREPIEVLDVPFGVAIGVTPITLDAPDIEKIIVERDGTTVLPIRGALTLQPLTSRLGATVILHAGVLEFPCSAFVPGAAVVVTAIPKTGTNLVRPFGQRELALVTGVPVDESTLSTTATSAADLVGRSAAVVRNRLGVPLIEGARWSYKTETGDTLYIYFDFDETKVQEVRPTITPLSSIKR